MFIGHFAVGFAAKRAAPEAKLWTLLLAATFLDVLWPVLVLLGLEVVAIEPGNTPVTPLNFIAYPYTHSLAAAAVWGVLFALVYRWRKGSWRGAVWLGLLVLSHWVLDFVSHRPDLPLIPGGGPKLGLGLWYSVPATIVVEAGMLAVGLALYVSATRARDRQGTWSLVILVATLLAAYGANLLSPPPPSVPALAIVALIGAALGFALATWVDRHRIPVQP